MKRKSKITHKKISKRSAKKVSKRTLKRPNPIWYNKGDRAITLGSLLNGISNENSDLIVLKIYGKYYKYDIEKNIDARPLSDIIRMIEHHKGEFIGEMTFDEIEELNDLIREMKTLPQDLTIILPQEFGDNYDYELAKINFPAEQYVRPAPRNVHTRNFYAPPIIKPNERKKQTQQFMQHIKRRK